MNSLMIFVFTMVFLLFWRWIPFIILAPIFAASNKLPPTDKNSVDYAEFPRRVSFKLEVKRRINKYIAGYKMYMDVQTGLVPSQHIRRLIYKHIYHVKMKANVVIYNGCQIRMHKKLSIGRGTVIGDRCILDARNGIEIGDNTNFSTNVQIWTEQHDHRDPYFRSTGGENFKVVIGNRVWCGPNSLILHGVHVGEGAVIAANSVVTRDVPPFTIVAGIPAKEIGQRNRELKYCFNGDYIPFY